MEWEQHFFIKLRLWRFAFECTSIQRQFKSKHKVKRNTKGIKNFKNDSINTNNNNNTDKNNNNRESRAVTTIEICI